MSGESNLKQLTYSHWFENGNNKKNEMENKG